MDGKQKKRMARMEADKEVSENLRREFSLAEDFMDAQKDVEEKILDLKIKLGWNNNYILT